MVAAPWDAVLVIAEQAGEAIMAHYAGSTAVDFKADRSPLTQADRDAHALISAALARLDPATPVISEEGEIPPWDARRPWSRFWLVDPLDGTKEFLGRNGEFTVNIALVEGGVPVLGVVLAPALRLAYVAARGHGAWRREAGGPLVPIASRRCQPGEPLTIVESRSHPSEALEEYLRTVPVARRLQVGSSLKFCRVAEGAADCYPRFGPTMEWDVAAGDCIWRNAAPSGENPSPLRYNTPTLRTDSFVIGGASANHQFTA